MTNDDWVDSTVPIGGGASNTQEVSGTGVVDFTGTGLSMNFTSKSGTDTITVTRLDRAPNSSPDLDTVFDSQYWVVNQFGSGTFDANLTFTVNEDITASDESNPVFIRLCNRESNSDGVWAYAEGAVSVSSNSDAATFDNITNFSQLILGRAEFTPVNAGLTGVYVSSVAWGDYDNDGDLDILLTGADSGWNPISQVYRNDGGAFTDISAGLTGVRYSSVAWGDYDNDGDLDILLTGWDSGGSRISKVCRNNRGSNTFTVNSVPNPPSNLQTSVVGQNATLSWSAASDSQTPTDGLTYNLRMGTSSGGVDAVSPMAFVGGGDDGLRKIAALGSQNHNTSWTLNLSDDTTYYWSVQALDTGFMGSEFAGEGTFTINALPTVTSFSPPDEGNILVGGELVIQFSEDMFAQSGKNITIYNSNGSQFEQTPADDSRVTVSGSQVTINPDNDFVDGNSYYVNIDAGAFKDSAGNDYAGISDDTTWNFTAGTGAFPGAALDFDGSDDYVEVSDDISLNVTNTLTMEVWVKLDNSGNDQKVVGKTPINSG